MLAVINLAGLSLKLSEYFPRFRPFFVGREEKFGLRIKTEVFQMNISLFNIMLLQLDTMTINQTEYRGNKT